jgi:hypothetical protein
VTEWVPDNSFERDGAPHPEYAVSKTGKPVADIWNLLCKGVCV